MSRFLLPVILPLICSAQTSLILRLGDAINLIPPAANADGTLIAFAAAVAPDGTLRKGADLYLYDQTLRRLTSYSGEQNVTGVSSVTLAAGFAAYAVLAGGSSGVEEVRLININGTGDRTLVTDKEGCIQPLCVNCFRACVGPVHLTSDAGKVLYAVARNNPFFTINADGSERKQLPIYVGALAPSPQRAISRAGQVVFTSSAPFGPTFAPAATDVYIMRLDGSDIRQVTRFGNPQFFAGRATISADGSLIAFESNYSASGPRQGNQIWVVRSDGTGLRMLSTGSETASAPSISADGSVVVFLQGGQIQRARTSGDGVVLPLTKLALAEPRDPVVSDDGSRVVFTLGPMSSTAAAVYRIPTDTTSELRAFFPVYVPRFINAYGVASAAGYGAPSPGSLISLYGVNLGPDELTQARSFPLPPSMNGLTVTVNGQPLPLLAMTPWQINAQLPQSIAAGTATFQISYANSGSLPAVTAEVKSSAPAILAFPFVRDRLAYSQAAAFHAGTAIPADMDRPATPGEVLEIYGVGLGVTDPMAEPGMPSPASPPARAVRMPRVLIGTRDATVTFAGLVPGLVGVYQVNAIVPAGLSPGLHTLAWSGPEGGTVYASIAVR